MPELIKLTVVLSGCIIDEEVVPAQLLPAGRSSAQSSSETLQSIEALTCHVEEADEHLVLHSVWEVYRGSSRLLVISNDTDTIVYLLHFMPHFREKGLLELWVEFGSGEHRRRHIPLHVLADKLGVRLCKVIIKAHVLTALSKIGTKHASLLYQPQKFLSNFAESNDLTEEDIKQAEEYLVHVWAGAKSKPKSQSFDQLRVECHVRAITLKPLEFLPPRLSVIHGHIHRAFFVVRNALCLLNNTPPPNSRSS